MTSLEKKIYDCALIKIQSLQDRVESTLKKPHAKYIVFPFLCDGVIDTLTYDCEKSKFTKVRYAVGEGQAVFFEGVDDAAFFDNVEYREIELD